ncbi:MAG: protease modulator HflC [Ruminococcaceae bacterium]|nr:protease modulator HflC [Oscillospiraceae bacterium]
MKKKYIGFIFLLFVLILGAVTLFSSLYTVKPNEYVSVSRFSKIVHTEDEAGLHFKIPFVDETITFPKTTILYDIPPSEVFTKDKKNMTVDCYLLWEIKDPLTFYQTLGTTGAAEDRLNVITYNALKKLMGTLTQDDIINTNDGAERNEIYEGITSEVSDVAKQYGIEVSDVKIKRFDLPTENENAVYERMISERNQMAQEYIAKGDLAASLIRNETDKTVNTTVSNAEAEAAAIEAEGEQEYMRLLAEAFNTQDKRDFYEFTLALDAIKATLTGDNKTVVIPANSKLGQILLGNYKSDSQTESN